MNRILEALNRPSEAFSYGKKHIAWLLVGITIFINSVFEPLLNKHANSKSTLDYSSMLLITLYGIITYFLICFIMWIICRCLGSRTSFPIYYQTWGFTYFPTIVCAILVAVTEAYFHIFWNSILWGMIFNILFMSILIWKLILYILYLREVAQLKKGKFLAAVIFIGIFILIIAYLDGFLGIKTPIL
jgi:membrane-associated HD superfamily phosphohydrolase